MKKLVIGIIISLFLFSCADPAVQLVESIEKNPAYIAENRTDFNELLNKIDFTDSAIETGKLVKLILTSGDEEAIDRLLLRTLDYTMSIPDVGDLMDLALLTKNSRLTSLFIKKTGINAPGHYFYIKDFPLDFKLAEYTLIDYLILEEDAQLLSELVQEGHELRIDPALFDQLVQSETIALMIQSGVDIDAVYNPSIESAAENGVLYEYFKEKLAREYSIDIDTFLEIREDINNRLSTLYEKATVELDPLFTPLAYLTFHAKLNQQSVLETFVDMSIPLDFANDGVPAISIIAEMDGIEKTAEFLSTHIDLLVSILQFSEEYRLSKDLFVQIPLNQSMYSKLSNAIGDLMSLYSFDSNDTGQNTELAAYIQQRYGDNSLRLQEAEAFKLAMGKRGEEDRITAFFNTLLHSENWAPAASYVFMMDEDERNDFYYAILSEYVNNYSIQKQIPYNSEEGHIGLRDIILIFTNAGALRNTPLITDMMYGPDENLFYNDWPMKFAFENNDADTIVAMLKAGVEPNLLDLYYALQLNNKEIAELILTYPIDINKNISLGQYATSPEGVSTTEKFPILIKLIGDGNLEAVKLAIELGAEVNSFYISESRSNFLFIDERTSANANALFMERTDIYNYLQEQGAAAPESTIQCDYNPLNEFPSLYVSAQEALTEDVVHEINTLSSYSKRLYMKDGEVFVRTFSYNLPYKGDSRLAELDPEGKTLIPQTVDVEMPLEEYLTKNSSESDR